MADIMNESYYIYEKEQVNEIHVGGGVSNRKSYRYVTYARKHRKKRRQKKIEIEGVNQEGGNEASPNT
jgi:hypothetical protein